MIKKGFFFFKNQQIYHHIFLKDDYELFKGEIGGYSYSCMQKHNVPTPAKALIVMAPPHLLIFMQIKKGAGTYSGLRCFLLDQVYE